MTKLGITLSSRAMFSTWLWHQSTQTLFDCGESVSLNLLTRIFGISRVCISHFHGDHIGGLITLIGLRAKLSGDTGRPLDVYGPVDNAQFKLIREYVAASWPRLPYELRWHPIAPGFTLQLDKSHRIEAFEMKHQKNATTLGYRVVEERRRLKAEYREKIESGQLGGGKEVGVFLAGLRAKGEVVDEVFHANTFCYCCDHFQLDPSNIAGADTCIMDTTFLDVSDRDPIDIAHASLEESVRLCKSVGVKRVVAAHQSIRNKMSDVVARAEELSKELDIEIVVCHPDRILEL